MTKRVKISIKALQPLTKGKKGLPVRNVLIDNCQKLLRGWISQHQSIGDYLIFEVVKNDSDQK